MTHPPVYYDVRNVARFIVRAALVAALLVGPLALASIWTGGQGL